MSARIIDLAEVRAARAKPYMRQTSQHSSAIERTEDLMQRYLASLDALSTTPMLIAMFAVTIVAGLAGAYIARCLFKKHFEKAGLV